MAELVPSDRELQALKVLWRQKEATVREICDAINEDGDDLAYTTVLSLLQVMEQKGLVGHKRVGKAYAYFAKVQRSRTVRKLAAGFLDKVFDGAVEEYLIHALKTRSITAEELEQLERAIADEKGQLQQRPDKGGRK
jgi:predicted transcriptional regulator